MSLCQENLPREETTPGRVTGGWQGLQRLWHVPIPSPVPSTWGLLASRASSEHAPEQGKAPGGGG